MKITKKDTSIVYRRTTIDHTFEINGKEVVIREYQTSEADEIEPSTIESGYSELTNEELEAIGEEMDELIGLDVNESFDTNN